MHTFLSSIDALGKACLETVKTDLLQGTIDMPKGLLGCSSALDSANHGSPLESN